MKYKGKKLEGRNKEIIPIPRQDGDIIFIAEAIESFESFDRLLPEPEPPVVLRPGGQKTYNKKDKIYLRAVEEHNEQRTNFMVLQSLKDSPDLEWETVDYNEPKTWGNFRKELIESGFSEFEIGRIILGVMRANSLDENMIEEARNNFLLGAEEQKD